MEPIILSSNKPSFLKNILVRLFLSCVFIIALRFAYIITIRGESCDVGDFCFFSLPDVTVNAGQLSTTTASSAVISIPTHRAPSTPKKLPDLWSTEQFQTAANFYSAVFQDLISDAILSPSFKTLCLDTPTGADVYALREIGVEDSVGSFKKAVKPLVVATESGFKQPFLDESLDFVFCGNGVVEKSVRPGLIAKEIERVLKVNGYLVVHTGTKDVYSSESLMKLFRFCRLVKTRDIHGFDSGMKSVKEVVLQKIGGDFVEESSNCSVSGFKLNLVKKAEPLIKEEPLKPWITLKKNAQTNIKYLPTLVDISFKSRYVYVDVGARSYGSSIVSWFKKQYPKQNKTFDVYAIEADKTFYEEYKYKKGVTLLPYAAWVRNESLFFEINEDPGHTHKNVEKGRGMGRIQPVQNAKGTTSSGGVDEIKGFDFADWLKNTVSETDYVVMKMDVEGTEFDLIPRLFETGAICLIDELFLECHYNRWQRCCPGERSTKYQKTYSQCLDLFTSLRKAGVLVHQWW